MRSEIVVDPDSLVKFHFSTFTIRKTASQVELVFKCSVNSFSDSIFVRIVLCCHTDINMVIVKSFCVLRTAILEATIRMMDQWPVRVFTVSNSHSKGINAINSLKIIRELMTDDPF